MFDKCCVRVAYLKYNFLTVVLDIAGSLLLCTSRRRLRDCGEGGVGWVEQARNLVLLVSVLELFKN